MPQNIVAFPTSTENKIQKLKAKLIVEAKILDENQFLSDELRLQYTKTQFYVYYEGLKSSLSNFIAVSNALAFKFVLLYIAHATKGECVVSFERIGQLYSQISCHTLDLTASLLNDFLQARDLILFDTPDIYKAHRVNEICSRLKSALKFKNER